VTQNRLRSGRTGRMLARWMGRASRGIRGSEYSEPPRPDRGEIPQAAARPPLASCQGVRIRGPSAVTAIVNSKCAASEPSWE